MEWKSIKKKSVKTVVLESYVIDIKNKYNLSYDKAKVILDKINHAICMKHIVSSNIKTDPSTGKIVKIDGVSFTPKGECIISYNKNNNYLSKNKDNTYIIESFNGLWNVYKNNIHK